MPDYFDMDMLKSLTTPAVYFAGEYDPDRDYEYGSVVIKGNDTFIYNGSVWEELGIWTAPEPTYMEEVLYHCVSCGAPTKADGVCPYCGTINRKLVK